jgi:hypothetical protein
VDFQTTLKANAWQRMEMAGSMLLLADIGVAASIELRIDIQGGNDESIGKAKKGFRAALHGGLRFAAVEMRSTVDTVVQGVISDNDIDFSFQDGATVNAVIQGLPLAVSNDRGTPGNLLYVSGVSLSDAPATSVLNTGPVAVVPAGTVVIAANAARRGLRFLNLGPNPVAIGAAGLTWAKRAIVLDVGDVFIEDRAANLAWSGVVDVGLSANVNVQEVIA